MNEEYFIYRNGQKIELTSTEVAVIYIKKQREYHYEDVVENIEYIVTEMLDLDREIVNKLGEGFIEIVYEKYHDKLGNDDGWFDILVTTVQRTLKEMDLI